MTSQDISEYSLLIERFGNIMKDSIQIFILMKNEAAGGGILIKESKDIAKSIKLLYHCRVFQAKVLAIRATNKIQ